MLKQDGYASGPGWDACTGFGSIVGTAMETALTGIGLPPAMAVYNGKLYVAWKGPQLDERIFEHGLRKRPCEVVARNASRTRFQVQLGECPLSPRLAHARGRCRR